MFGKMSEQMSCMRALNEAKSTYGSQTRVKDPMAEVEKAIAGPRSVVKEQPCDSYSCVCKKEESLLTFIYNYGEGQIITNMKRYPGIWGY